MNAKQVARRRLCTYSIGPFHKEALTEKISFLFNFFLKRIAENIEEIKRLFRILHNT